MTHGMSGRNERRNGAADERNQQEHYGQRACRDVALPVRVEMGFQSIDAPTQANQRMPAAGLPGQPIQQYGGETDNDEKHHEPDSS